MSLIHIGWGLNDVLHARGFCDAMLEIAREYRTDEEISQFKQDEEFKDFCRSEYTIVSLMGDFVLVGLGLYWLNKSKRKES
ncbi:MAG: hypothetical protein A3D35_02545 [Candidatus Staskawiczbacteria bacterium RIFCSPHIGHO2_02_FULL_34_9]|uniref:Uncharacterized protein n=1 Tax=Candidatus Staskawiczbacteria bacterium RIFCSPHIGHO2_02_FULL_34_9 TaxID=1802206 RepID=A0A1G2HYJ7_9BACT|nr:MAG: hypothetical protein A3D35_02545 [Candidatus Staskawiczbacteria bacterium RIFCSPHIGHO2_02_FULL_34_9]